MIQGPSAGHCSGRLPPRPWQHQLLPFGGLAGKVSLHERGRTPHRAIKRGILLIINLQPVLGTLGRRRASAAAARTAASWNALGSLFLLPPAPPRQVRHRGQDVLRHGPPLDRRAGLLPGHGRLWAGKVQVPHRRLQRGQLAPGPHHVLPPRSGPGQPGRMLLQGRRQGGRVGGREKVLFDGGQLQRRSHRSADGRGEQHGQQRKSSLEEIIFSPFQVN